MYYDVNVSQPCQGVAQRKKKTMDCFRRAITSGILIGEMRFGIS